MSPGVGGLVGGHFLCFLLGRFYVVVGISFCVRCGFYGFYVGYLREGLWLDYFVGRVLGGLG